METNQLQPPSTDRTVPLEEVAPAMLMFNVVLVLIIAILFLLGWGWRALVAPVTSIWTYLLAIPILALSVVLHEGIHGLMILLPGGKPISDVKFGFMKEYLAPYAHCTTPLKAWQYRVVVLAPGLVLGVLPTLAALWLGWGWLLWYGVLMMSVALGDLLVWWMIRDLPRDTLLMDHPAAVGCLIVEQEDTAHD